MDKLNLLIKSWVKGSIKLSSHLIHNGYSKELLQKYVKSNWLDSLGYGAYKLSEDKVDWFGAVEALQTQKNSIIRPGGKTALELLGYAHYPRQKQTQVNLYSNYDDKLPAWFKKQSWSHIINFTQTKVLNYTSESHFTKFERNNIAVKISTPELAIMEMLYLVPTRQTFTETFEILEGLTALKPKLVQRLLEECKSIKVNRLFLFMAEVSKHNWVKELNIEKINLGSGKRVIIKNGVLDKKYKITVPKRYER